MARLILLNGPPGIGKTTLALRYVHDHSHAFCLDIDGIRRLIGGWDESESESGLLARKMAVAMARVHLDGGHDVVVPQFLGRLNFIEQLEGVAARTGASFYEIVLMDRADRAVDRFTLRAQDPALAEHHSEAARMVGGVAGLEKMYDQLVTVISERPSSVVIDTEHGAIDRAYDRVLAAVGTADAVSGSHDGAL